MPTGPKGQKRPADVIGNAVRVMRIATGDEADDVIDDGKDPAAKSLGAKGGKKRAANMTPERRTEIAKQAAAKRWQSLSGQFPMLP
ncbi:RNA-binding protein [Mesorhizobium sp. NZP2077]|nr:RNA-binding protein [Mesorhizobium sp. NZP2077]